MLPGPDEVQDGETAGEETTAQEGEEGEQVEGEETTTTDATPAELPAIPVYDKNAMEDMAPAERLRIN